MASWVFSSIQSLSSKVLDAVRGAPSGADQNGGVIREDLEKLSRLLARIQAVLQDAEEREINDRSVRLWLAELRGVAYRAEDVLDEFHYELLRSVVEGGDAAIESYHKGKNKEVTGKYTSLSTGSCSSNNTRTSIPDGMAEKIKIIIENFEEITKDREALRLREEDGVRLVTDGSQIRPPTSSQVDERSIFGREDEKKRIIDVLNPFDGPDFMVLPVVGMGGLGKTTLAQLVYNHSMVGRFFQKKAWVSISENFDLVRLTRAIVESVTDSPCGFSELSKLRDVLTENISGTSLFLVLDDVWNATESVWDQCRAGFIGAKTVRILITTRNTKVAEIMQTTSPLMLDILPKEKCWLLFKHFAFHNRKASENATLLKIGDGIVDKCKGSPLAIKVLGGLLRHDTDEEKWRGVLESDLLEIDESGEIFPILHLSYRKLPLHLRPCFLYLSIFPKGTKFEKTTVIRLWMAQGYISGNSRTNKTLEEIGTSYFDELHGRSLIDSRDTSYRLHDLMHDLARFISQTRNGPILKSDQQQNTMYTVHHIYFTEKDELSHYLAPRNYRAVRTYMQEGPISSISDYALFSNIISLRVLDLRCSVFPDTVGTFKHLRYLYVSNFEMVRLPESICLLYNLQTLNLNCVYLRELPENMKNLVNLRYLYLSSFEIQKLPESVYLLQKLHTLSVGNSPSFNELPRGIAQLTGLRVLVLPKMTERGPRTFDLPYGIGNLTKMGYLSGNFNLMGDRIIGGMGELKDINKLHGLLCISGLKNISDSEYCRVANLASKTSLKRIILNFKDADWVSPMRGPEDIHLVVRSSKFAKNKIDRKMQEGVLESLQPNGNLQELDILFYQGRRYPSWLLSSLLPKLENLRVRSNDVHYLPPLALPNLRSLDIKGYTHNEKQVLSCKPDSFIGGVSMRNMPKLVEWAHDSSFPHIKVLEIWDCPHLRKLPPIWAGIGYLLIKGCGCQEIKFSPQSKIERICISDCANLVSICYTNRDLPTIVSISLFNCPRLEAFSANLDENEQLDEKYYCSQENKIESKCTTQHASLSDNRDLISVNYTYGSFPVLKTVFMSKCPKLRIFSVCPEKLFTLKIKECGFREIMLPSKYQKLEVDGCPELYLLSWRDEGLDSFEKFAKVRFINCPELRLISIPGEVYDVMVHSCNIHHIILPGKCKMKSISISDCPELLSVHWMGENIKSLRELKLVKCPKLMSDHFLESNSPIRKVSIISCPQYDKALLIPYQLEELEITNCSFPQICLLPQSKLRKLIIAGCSKLMSVEGLNWQFNLKNLRISRCPILELSLNDVIQHIREILKPAFAILRDETSKCLLLLVHGTHSIKDTQTAATGAVVPFHHSLVDQGGVTKLVLGYAHCGMVAGARWIAKCTIPCLSALSQNPDYRIKIVGHSLGGGTAALLTYILREHEEFSSTTCVAFAPAACMTWDLAESGKQFITSIVNGADIVPTFSTASVDDLRSEVTASSWINDLRDQVQQTPLLNVVYRSASALGSRLPSISTARERVAGARLLLRPVSTKTQGVMKGAQNVAQAMAKTTALSSWSCIGRRRRPVGTCSPMTDPSDNQNTITQLTVTSDTIIIKEENFSVSPVVQTIAIEGELESDNAKVSDQEQDGTEEDALLPESKEAGVSSAGEITEGELWYELEKEFHSEGSEKRAREAEAAVAKEIIEEENEVRKEAADEGAHTSDQTQVQTLPEGQQRFYPPGRIMHMVVLPPCTSESAGDEVDASVIAEELSVGIYETPRELYSRIRLSKSMINDHYMPMHKKMMEMLIEKFAKEEELGCTDIH